MMRGGRFNYTPDATNTTDAVEKAQALHKEECERRCACRLNQGKKANTPWDSKPAKTEAPTSK